MDVPLKADCPSNQEPWHCTFVYCDCITIIISCSQQLFQVCLEGKVKDVDGVVGKWNKRKHNCNDINEVTITSLYLL